MESAASVTGADQAEAQGVGTVTAHKEVTAHTGKVGAMDMEMVKRVVAQVAWMEVVTLVTEVVEVMST